MSKLPSLHALRVFESAARLGSFTKAGEELLLTQSAVSKQVARLEQELGQPLFHRRHRALALTEVGEGVYRAVSASFGGLAARLEALTQPRPRQLRIVADADFAQLWLFPRLARFDRLYPNLRISLTSETSLSRPPERGYDCALLWGHGDWANCRVQPLFTNTVFPVAAPDYFRALGRPPQPSDLESRMLIHDRSAYWWSTLLATQARGLVSALDPDQGRIYSATALCLEAAARGDGITIGDEVTTRDYLEDGRLVLPFAWRHPSPEAYFLVQPPLDLADEALALFTGWLLAEAAAHSQWFAGFWAQRG